LNKKGSNLKVWKASGLILYTVSRAILTYAASAWGIAAPSYTENLQGFAKRYLKIISNYYGCLSQQNFTGA
jgi:cytoplasmic iron level regulating protein YaaA (DUF328/UPF0246 family)